MNQANAIRRVQFQIVFDELGNPRAGGVDQRFGANRKQAAVSALQVQFPQSFVTTGADATGLGVNVSAFFTGGHRIEYYKAGVIDPAVRILKAFGDFGFQWA